jgi:cell division septation protein DedD
VSELSHDTADDGFHEIQLSGKQLVFLFIVTTTVIVVVFLCGVKVGRGARAAQGEEPEAAAVATTTPQATPGAGPPAAEPPAPAAEAADELSYHRRLQKPGTSAETLKPQEEAKPQAEPAPRPAPPVPAPRAADPPAAASAGAPAARPGTWAVQVIATRDRDVAGSILNRLVTKGYPAFLVNPPAGATPAFYKVHVGRYNDRAEAEQVSRRITKEEQFQSWITR